jgi:voltage-gated potassium channel
VAVAGTATSQEALSEAFVQRAKVVIVALARDDSAVLATLAVRRIAPHVCVVASAREAENAELLSQSGAQSVVVSSETAGRLLGLATESPETVFVFEDLLAFGRGLDLVDRKLVADEVGRSPQDLAAPVLAVVRNGQVLRYNDPDVGQLRSGDRVIYAKA